MVRIFAWENVRPSKVLTNCVSTGAIAVSRQRDGD